VQYVIALGSNLGDRHENLTAALKEISKIAAVLSVSKFYETAPVGGPDQPDYVNAVAIVAGDMTPTNLLLELQKIENSAGRTREVRWGARTLDLDIIIAEDVQLETEFLTLPHPRAHERAFVLAPWAEIDPDAHIIGKGPISSLLSSLL
jgi:2-amino-4-hydroxy-6-hydroxymethyldihydropteridine diphosphokinase